MWLTVFLIQYSDKVRNLLICQISDIWYNNSAVGKIVKKLFMKGCLL